MEYPTLLRNDLIILDRQIKVLQRKRQNLIDQAIAQCNHPIETIYELPYQYLKHICITYPPHLICSKCGLTEEGWGIGYNLLRHAQSHDLLKISYDRWMKLKTRYIRQERDY